MDNAKLFSSWENHVTYGSEGPSPVKLIETGTYNAVFVGLESGQTIAPHPAPEATYHFLDGSGWMTAGDERMEVTKGTTIAVPAGMPRGMEADTRLAVLASHAVPAKQSSPRMPFRKMGLIGAAGIIVMAGLMLLFGLMMGSGNPMASLMFQGDGPLGAGLWAIMIAPFVVMPLMMGTMYFVFRRMQRRGGHTHSH